VLKYFLLKIVKNEYSGEIIRRLDNKVGIHLRYTIEVSEVRLSLITGVH